VNKIINKILINSQNEYLRLIIVFILIGGGVLLKSYFDNTGYISNDSSNYLSIAQSLINGNGFYCSSLYYPENRFFACWPVGYPLLIYFVSTLTGFSVFWGSKIVNILLIAIILIMFKKLFNKNAYLYGFILCFASFIEIFSYTFSETAFILGLVWFSLSLFKFVNQSKNILFVTISLFLSSLFLFLSRYIGAFSIGIMILFAIYLLIKKEKFKSILLITISVISLLLIFLYLYNNYTETGFMTGMPRIPALETNASLFKQLLSTSFNQLIVTHLWANYQIKLVFIMIYSLIIFAIFKYRKHILLKTPIERKYSLSITHIFGLVGIIYLFCIICMRWMTHFDRFTYRLIAPGTFLLLVALIHYLNKHTTKQAFHVFKILLITSALSSLIVNIPLKRNGVYQNNLIYSETINTLKEKYDKIEDNSVIIFGEIHLNYLCYKGINTAKPFCPPIFSEKENLSDFLLRINPNKKRPVYLNIPVKELKIDKYDISFIELFRKYKPNSLIRME